MARRHRILHYERDGETLVITPAGDSLSVEENVLKAEVEALHEIIATPGTSHVIVDIGAAPYFGSLILGALIAVCKRITDIGGKAAMCNASPGMKESLQIMRIHTIIPYYDTREEAMTAVRT